MTRRRSEYRELFIALDLDRPLQEQLLHQLRNGISTGELAAERKLPSTRALAERLRISRTTTQRVYDQLQAEGYLITRRGSGTFITPLESGPRPAPRKERTRRPPRPLSRHATRVARSRRLWGGLTTQMSRQPIHFHPGVPDPRLFPSHAWARLLGACARENAPFMRDYPAVLGTRELRVVLAHHLATTRGVQCNPEQIVIVTGMHQGLGLVARVLADDGDVAIIEDPGYVGAASVLDAEGMHLIAGPVDAQGIDPRRLRVPQDRRVRLVYVTPSHQFPSGVVLSYPRRRALLAWARRHDAMIFEEDYLAEFRYRGRPIASLYGLDDSESVVHGGTFAKSMSPALRIGYLVVPTVLVEPIEHAKWLADFGAPALEQVALARFIESGAYTRHLRRCRTIYWRRRDALLASLQRHLPQARWSGDDAGLHLLVHLTGLPARAEPKLIAAAEHEGVGIMSARIFYAAAPDELQLLLGYACLNEREIEDGIRRLARAVRTASRR